MSDPSAAVVAAIRARLTANGVRFYDEVPAPRVFPYVSLGPVQVINEGDGCTDGSEVFVQLDGWSKVLNAGEIGALAASVRTALATDLVIAGHHVVDQELEDARFSKDPGGGLNRAVFTLRLATEPSA